MKRSDLSRFLDATVFRGLWITSAILIATISIAAELPSTRKAPVDNLTVMKPLPPPVVVFTGKALIVVPNGGSMSRYNLAVTNYQFYPPALFAQAPNLPPCGSNTNSARTWVEIYYRDQKQQPHRIYGFCALGSPRSLRGPSSLLGGRGHRRGVTAPRPGPALPAAAGVVRTRAGTRPPTPARSPAPRSRGRRSSGSR